MKLLYFGVIGATLLAVSGCTSLGTDTSTVSSLSKAGTTTFDSRIVTAAEGTVKLGTEYHFAMGKEYDSISIRLSYTQDSKPIVTVKARGVRSFEGQATAHAALVQIRSDITAQNIKLSDAATMTLSEAIKALQPGRGILP